MTTRTYKRIDSKGREEEWSWEETPAVTAALKAYMAVVAHNMFKLGEF